MYKANFDLSGKVALITGAGRGIGKSLENDQFRSLLEKRTPMRRLGQLHELIAPVVMFCSEGAGYITGQNLFIDGDVTNDAF